MISDEVLGRALDRQILSSEQVKQLRALAHQDALPTAAEPTDDEKLRFITGFGDIFVTMGLGLFLGSLGYFVGQGVGRVAMWVAVALAAWALAEFFTRARRMALPSIVLLSFFAAAVFFACAIMFGASWDEWRAGAGGLLKWVGLDREQPLPLAGAALATAVAVALHYARFRVPITPAAGAASGAAALIGVSFAIAPGATAASLNPLLLICGLGVFALAMRFDFSDPSRLTRRTDIAFWLHMLAAPLIVHPLISGFLGARMTLDGPTAVLVIVVFLGLGAVAVLIDRRAMLVAGLAYAGIAFGALIRRAGLTDATIPWTLFALGAFVLLLSAGWRTLRTAILRILPSGLAQRLPNPSARPVS